MRHRDSRTFARHFRDAIELQRSGRPREAAAAYERAIAADDRMFDAHNNLGCALLELGRAAEAVKAFERALALEPENAAALDNLGLAFVQLERPEAAIPLHERAVERDPANIRFRSHLGIALLHASRPEPARAVFEDALRLGPRDATLLNGLGGALDGLGRVVEAEAVFRAAVAADPQFALAASNLGSTLLNAGDIAGAAAWFERAIALEPRNAQFHYHAGQARTGPLDAARLAQLEALRAEIELVPPSQRVYVHFALGAAYDAAGRFDEAFAAWSAGNAERRATLAYDEPATLQGSIGLATSFNPGFMTLMRGSGEPSERPVFIVGMPRSGTTLVEQLLAAQPGVTAAGELMAFGDQVRVFGERLTAGMSPDDVRALIRAVGAAYVRATDHLAGDGVRLTDKMPGNVWYAPLIHLALPNARIVHVRRNRVDTCLSCFATLFTENSVPYAYDLGELGRYYRAYESVSARWPALLAPERYLEVEYERLVEDFPAEARRITAFVGLTYDERAPAFHDVRRIVRTASAAQVRRPLYTGSVGRSSRYAAHLGPLLAALGAASVSAAAAVPLG